MIINNLTSLQCVTQIKGIKVPMEPTLKEHMASVVISIKLALKQEPTRYPRRGQDKDCFLRMN